MRSLSEIKSSMSDKEFEVFLEEKISCLTDETKFNLLRDIIINIVSLCENGRLENAYKLSRSKLGNSGYSFGLMQHDLRNSAFARQLLANCGVPLGTVAQLSKAELASDTLIDDVDQILTSNKARDLIRDAARQYVSRAMDEIRNYDGVSHLVTNELLIHLVDMEVQFNLNAGGLVHRWVQSAGDGANPWSFAYVKLTKTVWGRERKGGAEDIMRRFNVINGEVHRLRNPRPYKTVSKDQILTSRIIGDGDPDEHEFPMQNPDRIPEWMKLYI